MASVEDFYNDSVDSIDSNSHHDKSLSPKQAVIAMLTAFARAQKHRELLGVESKTLSAREYERFRTDDMPHWWDIAQTAGSWEMAKKVLPADPAEVGGYTTKKSIKASPEELRGVLLDAGEFYGVKPYQVSLKQLESFAREHPERGICDWRVYCRYILGRNDWQETKNRALRFYSSK